MTYPTSPSLSFDFSAYSQSQGDSSFPGEEIDVDLEALQASIEEIIAFLQGFTRSDGQLANGSVSREQLGTDVRLGFDAPTVWAADTAYTTTSSVFFGNGFYIATIAHTSGSDFNVDLASGRWLLLADFTPIGSALIQQNNLSDVADATTARQNLGLRIGTDIQAYNAKLAALAGLTLSGNQGIYATGANSFAAFALSAFARTLLDDADAATARATLSTPSVAEQTAAISAAVNAANQFFHIYDEKPNSVGGGTSVVGWQTRELQTESPQNNMSGAVLHSATEFSLPAGSFDIEASAPGYRSNLHRIRLWNVTSDALVALGTSEYSLVTPDVQTRSVLRTQITLTETTRFRLDHYINSALSGFGLGVDTGGGTGPELYSMLTARKYG